MSTPKPLQEQLKQLMEATPVQAGTLATAYRDLALAIEWTDLRALMLPGTKWSIIVGHKRSDDALRAVLPLPLHTTALVPSELKQIFAALKDVTLESLPPVFPPLVESVEELQAELKAKNGEDDEDQDAEPATAEAATVPAELGTPGEQVFDQDTLYVAIGGTDSTTVYYKLSRGIRKPHDVPDE